MSTESPPAGFATLGRLLERGVELDALLGAMVDEAKHALRADRGTLYLVDAANKQIFSKAAHLPELAEIRLAFGQGVAGVVVATASAINLGAPYDDPRFDRTTDERTGYRTCGVLAAPVPDSGGNIIGVLQVLNKHGNVAFDDVDQATLSSLAVQAGGLLERTSLYSDLRPHTLRVQRRLVDYRYNCIVGTSTAMQQAYALVDKAADTDATVLLQGESGTGKGLVARAIHLNSKRRDGPLVTVDCTTLPPTLMDNELFGHEKGAYTGASQASSGKIERANGGTLFIDEIGELPLEVQGKLLRVIQERTFERVGGTRPIKVDFRLIAATHRDLDAMVAAGTFRTDLYYRIRVIPILLPPLRARGADDIMGLADHFLEVFAKKHRRSGKALSPRAVARLTQHTWPGNIRELENCIESAVVLADGSRIEPEHLTLPLGRGAAAPGAPQALNRTLAQAEADHIRAVVADYHGNHSLTTRHLSITHNTLARKLA